MHFAETDRHCSIYARLSHVYEEIYPNLVSYRAGNRMRWLALLMNNDLIIGHGGSSSLISELYRTSRGSTVLVTPDMNCSLRRPDSGPSRCGDSI